LPALNIADTPSSPFIPKSKIPDVAQVGLHFTINGSVKQSGTAKDMIFGVPELISFVSGIMKLEASSSSICHVRSCES
jgi:acylpyruvate hydrolase